jgi:hypothetical protein
MKKVLAAFAALAIAGMSTMAFADVKLGGSVDIRSRNLDNTADFNDKANDKSVITQTRFRLDVGVTAGDVKGKINIEQDWQNMGSAGLEAYQGQKLISTTTDTTTGTKGSILGVREAWLLTPIPGTPLYLKGGHMPLQLGNGWFFRNMKNGSDAWVTYTDIGALHLGLVNVKVLESSANASDDTDAYVLVATNKFGDATAGVNLAFLKDRQGKAGFGGEVDAQNLGLHFGGKVGPVALQAEIDLQAGKIKGAGGDSKLKGNQIVVQGNVPVDPVTVNFTVARGTGPKANSQDVDQIVTFLDADPHYTFLWEYIVKNPACLGADGKPAAGQGFCNTTAISAGATFKATKNLTIGADAWMLQATEDVASKTGTGTTSDLGTEIDVKVNWKMADNVSWNWTLGTIMAGDGLGKDDATGIQGVISMKF